MIFRRSMTVALTALATLAAGSALAQPAASAPQTLVPAKSEVTFVAKQLGVPLQGRFKAFQAQSAFDPKIGRAHV